MQVGKEGGCESLLLQETRKTKILLEEGSRNAVQQLEQRMQSLNET